MRQNQTLIEPNDFVNASREATEVANDIIEILFDNLSDLIRTNNAIEKVPEFANSHVLMDINLNRRTNYDSYA